MEQYSGCDFGKSRVKVTVAGDCAWEWARVDEKGTSEKKMSRQKIRSESAIDRLIIGDGGEECQGAIG
jgi:hypothetical protein